MKARILFFLLTLAVALPSGAGIWVLNLDPDRTSIEFRLGATLHSVHGSVSGVVGSLRLNTESAILAGEVIVDATSSQTGNARRDKKMHRQVLLIAEYPKIVLSASRIEGEVALEGSSEVTLHGEMELLGGAHEVAIPLSVEIVDGRFAVHGEFEVPYVEWGLEDPSTLILRVAKVVEITLTAEGTIVPEENL